MKEFGKKFKDLRIELGLGQVALAKELGVGKSIISSWERGESLPSMPYLILIAKYFKVTTDYLCGLED